MATKIRSTSLEKIESLIILLRGEKVILDSEVAKIYGIPTARLNQQVRRNKHRFPSDFMFQLTREEFDTKYAYASFDVAKCNIKP